MVRTYVPQWGVLSTDSIIARVSVAAKEVGPDLYRGLVLPVDRKKYEQFGSVEACSEMLGLLSMICLKIFLFSFTPTFPSFV